jgi:predicted RNA-binding protein with PUA-like domain
MAYWLFQGNPKYYRLLDAIQNLEEMPWLVTRYKKEIAVGDGVLVWMAGSEAGIYAIAEISETPQILSDIPDAEYWLDTTRLLGKTQAKIRFVRKLLGQPLRKTDLRQDNILKDLGVLRAPHSTNFKVTDEQWQRVFQLKG